MGIPFRTEEEVREEEQWRALEAADDCPFDGVDVTDMGAVAGVLMVDNMGFRDLYDAYQRVAEEPMDLEDLARSLAAHIFARKLHHGGYVHALMKIDGEDMRGLRDYLAVAPHAEQYELSLEQLGESADAFHPDETCYAEVQGYMACHPAVFTCLVASGLFRHADLAAAMCISSNVATIGALTAYGLAKTGSGDLTLKLRASPSDPEFPVPPLCIDAGMLLDAELSAYNTSDGARVETVRVADIASDEMRLAVRLWAAVGELVRA